MSLQIPPVIKDDWNRLRLIVDKLKHLRMGTDSSPKFTDLTLDGLTASKLIASNSNKELTSSDLISWITGTTNQIVVTDNGDGTITLSCPQDIHVDATPEFAGLVIKDTNNNIVLYVDVNEFYITEITVGGMAGQPIGLLLVLTYAS